MKKSVLAWVMFCCLILSGCSSTEKAPEETIPVPTQDVSAAPKETEEIPSDMPETVRVAGLKGPTTMGMVKLMEDAKEEKTALPYTFTIGTTDEIVAKISKGELDIAAVPANLASVLYHNTQGKIKVLAINTLGVLYVVERGEAIESVSDLAGKTLLSTGKGATPEFALNYVLAQNQMDPATDLTIEYKSEAAEILPLLMQDEAGVALLPQPFAAAALEKVPNLRIALDWTQEWNAVAGEESALLTGVVVVSTAFLEQYPDAVEMFMEEYQASTEFAQTDLDTTAKLVAAYGIVEEEIAKKALPYCNITCMTGKELQTQLSGYLSVLHSQNPQSIGGELPDEGFYYLP